MIKAILFDVDGVVLYKRDKYFSQRLVEDGYTANTETIDSFFVHEYPDIMRGKKDLIEVLSEQYEQWGIDMELDDLLVYWFSYETNTDENILLLVDHLRENQPVRCYMAIDHSKYRGYELWEDVGLNEHFDGMFLSADIGHSKEEKEYYEHVTDALGLSPDQILFIDDEPENITVATDFGLKTHLYDSNSEGLSIDL